LAQVGIAHISEHHMRTHKDIGTNHGIVRDRRPRMKATARAKASMPSNHPPGPDDTPFSQFRAIQDGAEGPEDGPMANMRRMVQLDGFMEFEGIFHRYPFL